ncbi:MAG TPA: hypothetical protein VJK54_05135 [Chthoniobacterales bacterium]|nr:hypothetical protein [Chthoniobacterales bacterium]
MHSHDYLAVRPFNSDPSSEGGGSEYLPLTLGNFLKAAHQNPNATNLVLQGEGAQTTIIPNNVSFFGRIVRQVDQRENYKNRAILEAFKLLLCKIYGNKLGSYVINQKFSEREENRFLREGLKSSDVKDIISLADEGIHRKEEQLQSDLKTAFSMHLNDLRARTLTQLPSIQNIKDDIAAHEKAALRIEINKTSPEATIDRLIHEGNSHEIANQMLKEAIEDEHPRQAEAVFIPIAPVIEAHLAQGSPSEQISPTGSTPTAEEV